MASLSRATGVPGREYHDARGEFDFEAAHWHAAATIRRSRGPFSRGCGWPPYRRGRTHRVAGAAPRWSRERASATSDAVRLRLAAFTWILALTAAVVLSLAALLVALDANTDNGLVARVLDLARAIDGPFWRVFDFYEETPSGQQGPPDDVKNHLVNWGLAAAAFLIVGRVLSSLIRPIRTRSTR